MIKKLIITLPFIFFNMAYAQSTKGQLKSNEAYLTEITRNINSASFQGNQIIKKSLKSEPFSIPEDWRLVSVINLPSKNNSSPEYVLFFQDSNAAVHSLGVQSDGLLSGNNLIYIPASSK
jgi:hypothetical protein